MITDNTETTTFLDDVLSTQGGRLVAQCYQCGTCSGSCPVLEEMEYGPRRIVYLIQHNQEEMVLSSPDMFRCVSCFSCMNRCPRGIEITDLMADLRRMAVQRGYAHDKEAEFGQSFAETVQRTGRMFEPEVIIRYYARVLDITGLLGMVPLGIKMILKGKLPFLPERIEDAGEIERMEISDSVMPKFATFLRPAPNKRSNRKHKSDSHGIILAALGLLLGWISNLGQWRLM